MFRSARTLVTTDPCYRGSDGPVNQIQLWSRRLGQAFAVLRDPDAGLLLPLPRPAVDPRIDGDQLIQQAREKGLADGGQYLYDGWSFGRTDDSPDAVGAPKYVVTLRHQCESAVHEHRDRQQLTDARLADLHCIAAEADRFMHAARDRMARIATREQRNQDESLRSFLARRRIGAEQLDLPPLDHPVWEGETPPLRTIWRALILLFLGAAVFEVYHYVTGAYLPLAGLGHTAGPLLTGGIAGLTVVGPLVSGQLFRNRSATGYDRALAALTVLLMVPTLVIVLGFGWLAATLLDRGGAGALGLAPATTVVIFDVVLVLAGAMAYILGLARPHPFQQAFARNRRVRDRTIQLAQRMGTRINGDYRATPATGYPVPHEAGSGAFGSGDLVAARAPDREAAIRAAYRAAEEAYYQGLIEAVADPTFTEAVMRNRNRTAVPAGG